MAAFSLAITTCSSGHVAARNHPGSNRRQHFFELLTSFNEWSIGE
jgi:hypothetical protein